MDAVANIIYWPNYYEKKPENPFGIEFLKKLNQVVHEYDPDCLMIGRGFNRFASCNSTCLNMVA